MFSQHHNVTKLALVVFLAQLLGHDFSFVVLGVWAAEENSLKSQRFQCTFDPPFVHRNNAARAILKSRSFLNIQILLPPTLLIASPGRSRTVACSTIWPSHESRAIPMVDTAEVVITKPGIAASDVGWPDCGSIFDDDRARWRLYQFRA